MVVCFVGCDRQLLSASVEVAVEGITVNLSAAPFANVHPQTLLPLAKPPQRMCRILTKAEVSQPKPHVTFQASGIDLLTVSFHKAL
jgi:hypothetical protein